MGKTTKPPSPIEDRRRGLRMRAEAVSPAACRLRLLDFRLVSSPRQWRWARSSPPVAWHRSAPPSRPPPCAKNATNAAIVVMSIVSSSFVYPPSRFAGDAGVAPTRRLAVCRLAVSQLVRHLAVRRRVQTEDFLLLRHAQANGDVDDLEDDPGHGGRERPHGHHRHRLLQQLPRVAVEEAVGAGRVDGGRRRRGRWPARPRCRRRRGRRRRRARRRPRRSASGCRPRRSRRRPRRARSGSRRAYRRSRRPG